MNQILINVFPYEGIPEIILNFFSPEEIYRKGSKEIQKILERKYKTIKYSDFFGLNLTYTFFNGKLHSFNDEPAQMCETIQEWYYLGTRHRGNDKPAIVCDDGTKEWWEMGKMSELGYSL